jgi:hypothetical protein
MSRLPQQITAHLIPGGTVASVGDILVSLQLYWRGQPYYADMLGLTDQSGLVQISRTKIQSDFSRDQKLFPMDYKERLDLCDPMIDIVIRGGKEFVQALESISSNPLVDADVLEAYAMARNRDVHSTRVRVDLLAKPSNHLIVDVPVAPTS